MTDQSIPIPASKSAAVKRYGAAVALAIAITLLRFAIHPFLGELHPYILLYPTVLLVGMYGGLGPALVCLVVGMIPAMFLFDRPFQEWLPANIGGFLTALLVLTLVLVAVVLQRRERLAAHRAKALAQAHANRLEQEIQQHRRTEVALRRGEEQMRLLVESASDYAIFTLDLSGIVTGWNEGATRVLGYQEAEIVGQHGRILFTPEDRNAGVPEQELRLALERGRAEDERWHLHKDGTLFWASGVISRMGTNGDAQGYVKIMRDITARRETELALRESEERYRRLTELSPDAMIVLGDDRIIYANVSAQRLLGATRADQLIGKSVFEFIQPDFHNEVRARVARMQSTGQPTPPLDQKFMQTDGTVVDVEAVATLVPWKGREAIQLILHDVTDRKRNEDSLRHASELHRLLLRELDHRVRNNLASLISLIEITSSGKTDVREVAGAIRGRTQAMAAVHQLLSKQHWTTVELSSLIEAMRPPSAPGALHTKGPAVPIASRQVTALGMVLQELFSNSTKYGALGKPGGEVNVEWTLHADGQHDDRILEMLWRERGGPAPQSSEPTSGVGSGLIKGFVRSELRGQATLSYPAQGATHRFTLHLDPLPELAEMVG